MGWLALAGRQDLVTTLGPLERLDTVTCVLIEHVTKDVWFVIQEWLHTPLSDFVLALDFSHQLDGA